ncbi:aspartate aminotransferase family protein [Planctomycetota bacterium]
MSNGYKESNRIFEEAKKIIPGGVTKARVAHVPGKYPIYMKYAKGAHVWDVDDNEYIDWMCGYGCIYLGHQYKEVDDAVKKQMEVGFTSFLSNPYQNEFAQELIDYIPCAEMIRYFKTGSDATTAAVRIARIHTGRDKIIRWGYHGWHDWSLANFYGFDEGVPQATRDLTLAYEYNDLESVKKLFADNPGEIACLITMPFETEMPKEGFLEGLKKICAENGALLIFDEVRSGFRAKGGSAQVQFGVTPDIGVFNKAMGNGYPISIVCGKSEYMHAVEKGLLSATFFVSTLEMAAARKVLEIIKRDGVVERLWELGTRFQTQLKQIVTPSPIDFSVVGIPSMPLLKFEMKDEQVNEKAKMAFYADVAENGVYLHPNHHWFMNFSHTEEDVDRTMEVMANALKVAEKAIGV